MSNKKKLLSAFLLLIYIASNYAKVQDDTLSNYLKIYQIDDSEVFILAVNIFECQHCNSLIPLIDQDIHNKDKKIIYLMKNIRRVEAEYFLKTELKIDLNVNEIIIDEEFFNLLNSSPNSCLILIKNFKVFKNIKVNQALQWLNLERPLYITDSITIYLDESNFLLSDRIFSFNITNDSLAFIADYLYNHLSIYSLRNGNKLRSFDDSKVLIRYADIFFKYISQDSTQYDFLKKNYSIIEKNNFKLGEIKSFFVNNENIFIMYQINFVEPIDINNFDKYFPNSPDLKAEFLKNPVPIPSISPYLFLIKTDFVFNIKNFYFLGFEQNKYLINYLINSNNFYVDSNRYVYLSIVNMYKKTNSTLTNEIIYKDSMYFIGKFEISDTAINFSNFYKYPLPGLYREKDVYLYNTPFINFFKKDNKLLAYINALPNIYDLTNDTLYYLGYDSLTKYFSQNKFLVKSEQNGNVAIPEISIQINFIVPLEDMVLIVFSIDDKFHIGLYNNNLERIASREISPGPQHVSGIYADNQNLYFLGLEDEKKVILKLRYKID